MKSFVVFVGLIILTLCNVHLNVKYRDVLHGRADLTEELAREIYSEFSSVYAEKSESRFEIFRATLEEIRSHNMKKSSWTQGINDYSDLTFEQFSGIRLMAPQNCSATHHLKVSEKFKKASVPAAFEWNRFGVVTPVKNQGSCGSCWTFSTVGAMESFWNILGKGKDVIFAEQQLVDCAQDYDNHGCSGGLPSHAFEYIKYNGLATASAYPYTAKDGTCVFRPSLAVGYCKYGSYNITLGDEQELAERLYVAGPISVSFQVITGFKNYQSGVYSVDNCGKGTQEINHAVLATGYGEEAGKKFWNVKNSWGATWGDKGYFKIERDVNMCAISQCNAYPLIDRPETQGLEEVTH